MRTEQILDKFTPYLADIFREEQVVSVPSLPGSAEALLVWAIEKTFHKTILWISDGPNSLEIMHRDMLTVSPYHHRNSGNPAGGDRGAEAAPTLLYYPAWEAFPGQDVGRNPDISGYRLSALLALADCVSRSDLNPQSTRLLPTKEGGQAFRRVAKQAATCPATAGRRGIPQSFVITTCIQALMQKTIAPAVLPAHTLSFSVGDEVDPEDMTRLLNDSRYDFTHEVVEKGQASIRGGLLDVWPLTEIWPFRIEFMGSVIESIRSFNPEDQRSVEKISEVTIPPATELIITNHKSPRRKASGHLPKAPCPATGPKATWQISNFDTLLSYLPDDAIFVWSDSDTIQDHASIYEEVITESGASEITIPFRTLRSSISRRKEAQQLFIGTDSTSKTIESLPDFQPVHGVFEIPHETLQPDMMEGIRQKLLCDLNARVRKGQTVIFFFDTQGSLEHFRRQESPPRADPPAAEEISRRCAGATQAPPEAPPRRVAGQGGQRSEVRGQRSEKRDHIANRKSQIANLQFLVGILSEGFVSEGMGLVIVAESDLYGRRKMLSQRYEPGPKRPSPNLPAGTQIAKLTDIEPGDLVVHIEHGIGRYMGLYEIIFDQQPQEVLSIEYADNVKLHVPVSQAHLLSRYVGIARRHVELHHLGGKRWNREKSAAERSIFDLASSLLEIQAERNLLKGYAFSHDTPWQHEFEASFPYQETEDQQQAISIVKQDMQSSMPMDRLVCGDAGYGKTEVAMRAAFKAVLNEKQVVVLVPTTVLAQQHFQTFIERMSAYPIRIEMLSRFCSKGMQAEIINGMINGTVDIVIGTHSLLQPRVKFKDLGLVIIDEEQRFGVEHKERLKHIRRLVDVLTLTATPIPRTLYMSMTGAREISLVQTPPRERMAIETVVTRNTDKVVREAILREINREGQVFYLHNRVMTIDKVKQRLEQLVPEARIEIAHGQMASSELASVMQRFVAGEFEVLLCTTIIESGMDIPRANTILIDRADRFGMADLYQLRGRVGRSSHKAYAYLLLPAHGHIDSTARKRIGAVKKYSSLSAGFNLALRDLEIRGAGNMLGAEQSGHITAIGFGLYCQLLKRSVSRLKREPVPPVINVEVKLDFISLSPDAASPESSASIPYAYIEDERLRIGAYRKVAEASLLEDVATLRAEFTDRFGPLPHPVTRLLKIAELRIISAENDIRHIETRSGKVMLRRRNDYLMKGTRFPRLAASTPDKQLDEIIALVRSADQWSKMAVRH